MYTLRNGKVRVEESWWLGVGGAGRSCWSFFLSWDSAGCTETYSSLAGNIICTQQHWAGDNSAETVCAVKSGCSNGPRWCGKSFTWLCVGLLCLVLQHQSLHFWCFAGQWFRMSASSALTDLLILSQGKERKWSENNRWPEAQWNYYNQITRKSAAVSPQCFHEFWDYLNQRQRFSAFFEFHGFC